MLLCRNCKWAMQVDGYFGKKLGSYCEKFPITQDPINGNFVYETMNNRRSIEGKCGPVGFWWEPRSKWATIKNFFTREFPLINKYKSAIKEKE